MSQNTIYMNYRDTLAKADRLEELAVQMRKAAERTQDEVNNRCCSVWSGDARDEFIKKQSRLCSRAYAHADQLIKCADALRESARKYYEAEKLAQMIAEGLRI